MDDGEIIIGLVYVDDLLLVASSLAAIYKIKDALHKRFEMKDLGEAKVILGLQIRRDKALGTLKLLQGKYAAQVLEKFGMAECNPIGTPLEVGLQLVKADKSDDTLPYREAVGSLMYLMVRTRPDLAFAIGKLSRFVSCYGKEHWAAIKHVLRYVKGSMDKGLVFDKNSSCVLRGFSDADWAGDHETRRSTTGFTFIFGGAAVSWGSKHGLRWIKLSQIYPHSILGFIPLPCRSCVLIMYSVHAPTIKMCLINSPKAGYNVVRVEFFCLSLSESQYWLCSMQVFWGSPCDGAGGEDAAVGHQVRDNGRNVATTMAACLTRPSRTT